MAAGVTIKHKRKAGAFINGELAAGEWGLDVTNSAWYFSINGTTVLLLSAIVALLDSIGDVIITSPADNNLLAYDTASSKWINQTAVQAGVVALSEKGAISGVATLDPGGKIPAAQLPSVAVGEKFTAVNQAAMLALTVQIGDIAIRTDQAGARWMFVGTDPTALADWINLEDAADAVSTVFGRAGAIVAALNDYAASLVNNDSNVTGATVKAALETLNAGKAGTSHVHAGADITSGDLPTARMQTNAAAALQASTGAVSNVNLVLDGGTI